MSRLIKNLSKSSLLVNKPSLIRPITSSTSRHTTASAASQPSSSPSSSSTTTIPDRLSSSSSPKSLINWPITRITTLPNGIRVATEGVANSGETATVGVWLDTGSRYESEKNNGVAHFLEHMTFKGTNKRTRQGLEIEIENMGGHLNAYTSRESTVYYAKVFKNNIPQAMDILGDILTNSKIDSEDVERERETILREMETVNNNLEECLFDRLHQTAYRGCALGRTILGSQQQIENISRQDIKDYIHTHYTADRMVIAGAGAIDHDQLVQLAEKMFGNVPSLPINNKSPYKEPAKFTGSDILIRFDDMDYAYIAYGFPTAGWKDPDTFVLLVIQTILGGWQTSVRGGIHSTSPLVSNVARYELARSVSMFNTQYSDTGLFGIHAVASAVTLNNLMFTMAKSLNNLCYNVDENSLAEAKNQLKMTMLSHLDGSTAIAEDIGRQLLTYGRRMHPVEVLSRIEAIDSNAVKQCARRFFLDRDHALAAIGPIYELPDYNWIRSRSYASLI